MLKSKSSKINSDAQNALANNRSVSRQLSRINGALRLVGLFRSFMPIFILGASFLVIFLCGASLLRRILVRILDPFDTKGALRNNVYDAKRLQNF